VRIDQVQTVVKWILDRSAAPLDPLSYERLVNSTEQFDQTIDNGPDVRWMYLTAWATEDGRVNFRPDVYNLDGTGFVVGQPEANTF
jgi:murein L,D-transpeptidase YcbB/YkuD